jgi:DNA-binding response OmpR family regulator
VATTVLVIDDEAPIRLLCRVNLEAEGIEVDEAPDGATGLDGWAVAEELLRDERTAAVPIIFLTARADLRDREKGLDVGGLDYITKPFNPVELASLVRDVLGAVERGEREQLRAEGISELRALYERV